MILTGVWEPTFIENLLLKSLYLIYYVGPIFVVIVVISIIKKIIEKINKKER